MIILDVKTGYKNTPVDAEQAADYFSAVAEFGKRSDASDAIRQAMVQALPRGGTTVDPAKLRLVQVDWLFMPGKEQTASMSAREVAEGKNRELEKEAAKLGIEFNLFYYEGGSILKMPKKK